MIDLQPIHPQLRRPSEILLELVARRFSHSATIARIMNKSSFMIISVHFLIRWEEIEEMKRIYFPKPEEYSLSFCVSWLLLFKYFSQSNQRPFIFGWLSWIFLFFQDPTLNRRALCFWCVSVLIQVFRKPLIYMCIKRFIYIFREFHTINVWTYIYRQCNKVSLKDKLLADHWLFPH